MDTLTSGNDRATGAKAHGAAGLGADMLKDGASYQWSLGGGARLALLTFGMLQTGALASAHAATYTPIYVFKPGITDGVEASGPLAPGPSGSYYGVTAAGGIYTPDGGPCLESCGTVFKLTPSAKKAAYTKTVLFKFKGTNGLAPSGQIVVSGDGSIYGTTNSSWNSRTKTYSGGVAYRLTPPPSGKGAWKQTIIMAAGARLQGVIADSQMRLYGTTGIYDLPNGTQIFGSVYQLTPPASPGAAWAFAQLHEFGATTDYTPNGELTLDSSGALYGSSPFAGTDGEGQIFQITVSPTVTYSVLHEFSGTIPGTPDAGGGQPFSSVTVAPNGVLYGTTFAGGSVPSPGFANGVVFSLTPPGASGAGWGYQVLHNFDYYNGGFGLAGGVTLDPSGALYGLTVGSNQSGSGVIFELTPPAAGSSDWTETDLANAGYSQYYRMYEDGAGNFFGSTDAEIFKFHP